MGQINDARETGELIYVILCLHRIHTVDDDPIYDSVQKGYKHKSIKVSGPRSFKNGAGSFLRKKPRSQEAFYREQAATSGLGFKKEKRHTKSK